MLKCRKLSQTVATSSFFVGICGGKKDTVGGKWLELIGVVYFLVPGHLRSPWGDAPQKSTVGNLGCLTRGNHDAHDKPSPLNP